MFILAHRIHASQQSLNFVACLWSEYELNTVTSSFSPVLQSLRMIFSSTAADTWKNTTDIFAPADSTQPWRSPNRVALLVAFGRADSRDSAGHPNRGRNKSCMYIHIYIYIERVRTLSHICRGIMLPYNIFAFHVRPCSSWLASSRA